MDNQTLDVLVLTGLIAIPASGVLPAAINVLRNTPEIHRKRTSEYDSLNITYDYEDPGKPCYLGSLMLSAKYTLQDYASLLSGNYRR